MFTLPRSLCFFILTFLAFPALRAADDKAQPATPPVAAPAFLDVVTFVVHTDGENHKLVVTTGSTLLRCDETDDGYSILYNAQTDHYTGLEHRNYTYWEFSWPEVRDAVQSSKRYEDHLQELNLEGVTGDASAPASSTNSSTDASTQIVPDNPGYVWKQTTDRKKISGLDCYRWTGDTVSGDSVEAWCASDPLPKVQAAMERLRVINEPMALVPVREVVPSLVFPVYDALLKGGVTPVLITWGGERDKNHFSFVSVQTRDYKPVLFTIPSLYMKTTLVTMDGMIDQKK